MFNNILDTRTPLMPNDVVEITPDNRFIIDEYLACGGFCLMYLAHKEGSSHYVALKELFPRSLDYSIAEREADGTIRIYDPLGQNRDIHDETQWNELLGYFEREAVLTKKAGILYDESGKKVRQNNPDVLSIEGPYRDTRGNMYLAVDTFQGTSFRQLIESGFIKDETDTVELNSRLDEVLEVLSKTSLRLSKLHADNHILHLDLSPDNIYITKTDAATALTPHIIDYGSSYDMDDFNEPSAHRYTCNPHSAPEVLALSELNSIDCGYQASPASDTYSVASILFYAVTGMIFTSDLQMFDSGWKKQICDGYPKELHSSKDGVPFADSLIAFFEKGLSSSQEDRFSTADELYRELEKLRGIYTQNGNILSKVNPDELISYVVLDKYPLYNYKSADGNFHVLCFGSGAFVKRMVLSLISTGQMTDSHLYIHIVSSEPENSFKSFLEKTAPELEKYSNLRPEKCLMGCEYVTFSYEWVSDLFAAGCIDSIASKYSECRYIIVSMGTNAKNTQMAYLYGKALASLSSDKRTIINYYISEDAAANTRAEEITFDIPGWMQIKAFGSTLSSYFKAIRSLGQRSLKLAYLYDKLSNPRISIEQTARNFVDDEYNQRSSCASALHLKYKLASVGISPKTNTKSVISSYLKKLDTHTGILLELEHRRWMMYMIADGYTKTSRSDLLNYGYERMPDNKFNGSWKCKALKLHHCLVPCDIYGIKLNELPHSEWDKYESDSEIDAADYDDLDKSSLKVHLLAKEKAQRIIEAAELERAFDAIEGRLMQGQNELVKAADAEDTVDDSISVLFEKAKQEYETTRREILIQANALQYKGSSDLELLRQTFADININISGEISRLNQLLAVFVEFSAYTDYKAPDKTIVENLLWMLYSDSTISLIKLAGRTIADNITGALLLEPRTITFFGVNPSEKVKYENFFLGQGRSSKITCVVCDKHEPDDVCSALERVIASVGGNCVLDVTGADEIMVYAALRTSQHNGSIAVIRSCVNPTHIDNITGFITAPAYTLKPVISAQEIYSLYGAKELKKDSQYMLKLKNCVPALWKLYTEYPDQWNTITAFFANRGALTSELYFSKVKPENFQWTDYNRYISKRVWDSVNFSEVFDALEEKGFIRDFSIRNKSVSQYDISFRILDAGFIRSAFNNFFTKANNVFYPFLYSINYSQSSGYSISVDSGVQCDFIDYDDLDFSDKRNNLGNGRRIKYEEVFPILDRFEEAGLISDLSYEFNPKRGSREGKAAFSFIYADSAVKDCLVNAGNILELYVWSQAMETGFFDDCKANFYFEWESGITNELDVILTKGLSSLVISCKTAKFNKEHLYEISSLTNQFSVNSQPVIIYSSKLAVDDSGKLTSDLSAVKARARSMGIYLIDLYELDALNMSLGEKLVRIAENKDKP